MYEMSTRLKKPNTRVVLNSKEISEMMSKVRMNMVVPLVGGYSNKIPKKAYRSLNKRLN